MLPLIICICQLTPISRFYSWRHKRLHKLESGAKIIIKRDFTIRLQKAHKITDSYISPWLLFIPHQSIWVLQKRVKPDCSWLHHEKNRFSDLHLNFTQMLQHLAMHLSLSTDGTADFRIDINSPVRRALLTPSYGSFLPDGQYNILDQHN